MAAIFYLGPHEVHIAHFIFIVLNPPVSIFEK